VADGILLVELLYVQNNILTFFVLQRGQKIFFILMLTCACSTLGDYEQHLFLGQDEQQANVRAVPCQAFQSNWTDTYEKQCSFECITWQIFRLLSLKLCQLKMMPFEQQGEVKIQWEKEQVFPPVPFTGPNGLWALNALINQYLSLYINATKLWMTFVTKKGHFNAHKIAPRLVTWARFLSRMITPPQGGGPLTVH